MDVLIVAESADFPWLRYTLATTLNCVRPLAVHLLTYAVDEATTLFPECTVVSLSRFPFSVASVITEEALQFQYIAQLARLYAPHVLVLTRPYMCLDANACVLAPLPWLDTHGHAVLGTRHGVTYPYVLHMERLHPSLRRGLLQSADVPYCVLEPERVQSMLQTISHDRGDEPFWRLYLHAIHRYHRARGASEKEVYANWWATRSVPTAVTVRTVALDGAHAVTPLLADAKGHHLATCHRASLVSLFAVPWWKQFFQTPPAPLVPPDATLLQLVPAPAIVADWGASMPLDAVPAGWNYTTVGLEHVPNEPVVVMRGVVGRLAFAHIHYVFKRLSGHTVVVVEHLPLPVPVRINDDSPTGGPPRPLWWDVPPLAQYRGRCIQADGIQCVLISL